MNTLLKSLIMDGQLCLTVLDTTDMVNDAIKIHGLSATCAAALGIEPKAASIRYVRALERLQQKLMEVSCFKKSP